MKNMSMIIGIPLVIVFLLMASVMAFKLGGDAGKASVSQKAPAIVPEAEVAIDSVDASISDLSAELSATVDDGGAADLNILKSDASGL